MTSPISLTNLSMSITQTDPSVLAGPSTSLTPIPAQSLCQICTTNPPKYTCPRCHIKSCSLPCSRTHKARTGCTGERDRTAYVPMNAYGYAALMSDYAYLEDVGRKVEEWGRGIVKEGIHMGGGRGSGKAIRGERMRGGRGRGGGGRGNGRIAGNGQARDKRTFLAMQLGVRDIDMDTLPVGMDRAKRNKSFWDNKGKRAIFTLEFLIKPPPDPLTRQVMEPISIYTNKNDWDLTIRQILQKSITNTQNVRKNQTLLLWLNPDEEDDSIPTSVLCLMKRPKIQENVTSANPTRPSYYRLNLNEKLSKALRHKQFVEFPTIELLDETMFDGILVDEDGAAKDIRGKQPKRRKLNKTTASKAMAGLIGSYGSDEESGDNEVENVLNALGEYSGSSDGESDGGGKISGDEHAILEDVGEDIEDELNLDMPHIPVNETSMEDEDLDWGDDEIAEDEAKLASLTAAIQQRYSS